ncbi:MAG: tetratricopeptide repeat protein [Ginsengibacter sp.]
MLPTEAALKNIIQEGVKIETGGGQFRQGDETNIKDFTNGTLAIQAGMMTVNIKNGSGIAIDISKNYQEIKNDITRDYEEKITLLSELIKDKQDKIVLLAEKESGQRLKYETEIAKLKAEYDQHINEYKYKESQFNNFLELITHVDTNNTSENFKDALDLFVAGKEDEALNLLDDEKAEEELRKTEELESKSQEIEKKLKEAKEEALESKRKIAYERFLKANFFALKGDFKNAEVCYKKGVDILSDNLTNHYYASFLISQNRLEDSLYYFEKAIALAETESARAKSLAMLGLTLLDMNELKKGEENITKANEIITRLHTEKEEPLTLTDANIYIALGRISFERFQIDQAIEYTTTALDILDKLPDEEDIKDAWKAICLANLGLFNSLNLQYEEAIRYTTIFLELSEKLFAKNPKSPAVMVGVITSYNNLGRYHQALKNFELAEENFKKGISVSEPFEGFPLVVSKIIALLYCNLGRLYADSHNDIPAAKNFFEKSLEYRNKTLRNEYETIKFDTSFSMLYLARIYLMEKDLTKAEGYFKECLRIADNKPDDLLGVYVIFQNNAYYYYGNFLFEKNQAEDACIYWQKSMAANEKLLVTGNALANVAMAESIISVGKNYAALIKDNDKAIDLYKKVFALDIDKKIVYPESDVNVVIEAYGNLFLSYSESTDIDSLGERCDAAQKVLKRVEEILDLFPEIKKSYLWGLAISKRSLGVMYFQKKDHLSAEKLFNEEYEIFEVLLQENAGKYAPETLQLYYNAYLNYLHLGDAYFKTDKVLAQEKYDLAINCLNNANQLAIEYPEHPVSKSLKPLIDVEITRLNALLAQAPVDAESTPG